MKNHEQGIHFPFYVHLTAVLLLSLALIPATANFSFGAVEDFYGGGGGLAPSGPPRVLRDFISGGSFFSYKDLDEELTTL